MLYANVIFRSCFRIPCLGKQCELWQQFILYEGGKYLKTPQIDFGKISHGLYVMVFKVQLLLLCSVPTFLTGSSLQISVLIFNS